LAITAGGVVAGEPEAVVPPPVFVRGDLNVDGALDISDTILFIMLFFIEVEGVANCLEAFDANDNGFISLNDALYAHNYLFFGGPPPPSPFPGCGADDDEEDGLGCASYKDCPNR
jgi:hypothetical protein